MRLSSATSSSRFERSGRGQSVVEFALLVPIIILLVAGAIDLGNGYQTWINLTNAAREGARKASSSSDQPTICTYVTDELQNTGIVVACGSVAVSYPGASGADTGCAAGTRTAGCPVRVKVDHAMSTFVGQVFGINTISISAAVDMVVFS